MRFNLLLIILSAYCLTACVSKKTYEEAILNATKQSQNYDDQIDILNFQLGEKEEDIDTLRILYAEQRGANEVLLITQDRLQDRLDEVQNQVLAEQESKTSTAQDLRSVLNDKDETIRQREATLAELQAIISKQTNEQNTMMGEFSTQLNGYGFDNHSIKVISGELRISLAENLFFRPGQARVKTEGILNLARIAGLINKYPSIKVNVIGNTDNSKPKGYKDNLEFSSLRAANVVRVLMDEYGVSPSRIMAGGKGDFAPIASNETPEGKRQNKRLDFIITSRMDRVVKELDKKLKGEP